MKYNYFVGYLTENNKVLFITKIDNASRSWYAENGKPALKFTKTSADNMLFALCVNDVNAVIIKTPDFVIPENET